MVKKLIILILSTLFCFFMMTANPNNTVIQDLLCDLNHYDWMSIISTPTRNCAHNRAADEFLQLP